MKKTSKKYLLVLLLLVASCLLMCACASKKSITGTWRLVSGKYDGLEECVLEFRDIGEYIVYEGTGLKNDSTHGSYTYDNKQIDMIRSGVFHVISNYSLENNQLILITSSGQAVFTKVNINAVPKAFNEAEVSARYTNDYTVLSTQCVSSTETSRVYEVVISKAYKYLDNQITKKDWYEYSKLGEYWYLTRSEEIDFVDNWHDIVGSYDFSYITEKKLDISYFDGKTITLDFYAEQLHLAPVRINGTFEVNRRESPGISSPLHTPQCYVELNYIDSFGYESHWSTLYIDAENGVTP